MHHQADPRDIWLYQRARICQRFPAYTLESVKRAPAAELLRAMRLLSIADQVQS